ncbi:MAG: bifunctional UDP-sugar hydrolase/5'-nucleotidase [Candidatus Aminicenantes bacterium]|nr:bifunctional UDP-sugar hydrolase/5'-nucleotidase [Candidatus Aminicenantes bacterium]
MPTFRRLKIVKLRPGVCALLAAVFCLEFLPAVPAAAQSDPDLILLFTEDLHSAVLPHRVLDENGRVDTVGGFARIAAMIKAEREKFGDRVLAIDGGDMIAGTLFQVLFQSEAAEIRLLGLAGYEAATFGNHEFDYGPAALARALTTAKVNQFALPFVASNVVFDPKDDRDNLLEAVFGDYPVKEFLVLQKNGLKIGLFGLMGTQASEDAPAAVPVTFSNPIVRARELTSILRDREKVDLVVALSHSGTTSDVKYSEDEKLAREVPGIDVIVSGHAHRRLVSPIIVGSTIIVAVGSRGEDLGDLRLARTSDGRFGVMSYALRPVTQDVAEDPGVAAEITELSGIVDREVERAGGINPRDVVAETAFSLAMRQPGPPKSSWEIGLGDLVVDAYRRAVAAAGLKREDGPILVIHPWGNIRDSILPGRITGNDVFQVLSLGIGPDGKPGYPLVCVWLSGREIRRLMEVETTIAPGNEDAHLQIAGASVRYNPRRIPFDRVTRIEFEEADGTMRLVEPDRLYRVVANLYMARMIGYISRASHGILKLEPKDAEGKVRTDFDNLIVDADPSAPGVQEIKEWTALVGLLRSFPDTDGDGIPDIPASYASSAGRLVDEPSWNPIKLLAGAHGPTFVVLGLGVFVLFLLWFLVHRLRRRFARRKNKAAPKA